MTFLAIFDVDGTLVDSQHQITAAMDHAHDCVGLQRPPRGRVLETVGLSLPEAMRRLHPGLDDDARADLVAGYRSAFGALRERGAPETAAPLYPGVAEGLRRLAGDPRLTLGTATGKSRRGLDSLLAAHALAAHFGTLQCADGHPSKPHPSMVLAALAEIGVPAGRAAMIGDTEFDMAMGRAAGVRCIGVAWGYHPPSRLRAAGAGAMARDWTELQDLVLDLAG